VSATEITNISARLNATVNPNGAATTVSFQWRLVTDPPSNYTTITVGTTGAGTSPVPISYILSGLTPNNQYEYRVVATNISGTTYGANDLFTTLP
jgi:hypothetical protein